MVAFAQLLQHLQAGQVRQVDVQQHQVRPQPVDALECLSSGVGSPCDREAGYSLDVGAMEVRDPVVVVHDQAADHLTAVTFSGSRTLNSTPPELSTLTSPPRRWVTWPTSAM